MDLNWNQSTLSIDLILWRAGGGGGQGQVFGLFKRYILYDFMDGSLN